MSSNNKVLFCVDISGSVQSFTHYWTIVEQIKNKYQLENKSISTIFWSQQSFIEHDSTSLLDTFISERTGNGGTYPDCILQHIPPGTTISHLCLFTDGEVDQTSVNSLDYLLQNYHIQFDYVECHIIHERSPSLSVTCPFTRNSTSKVYTYTNNIEGILELQTTAESMFLLSTIETLTLDTFKDYFESLKNAIIAKNMGKTGLPAQKDKLILLKKKLIKELSEHSIHNFEELETYLQTNNIVLALQTSIHIIKDYYSTNPVIDISKKIDILIGLCGNLQHQFSIGQIYSNSYNRAIDVEETLPDTEIESMTMECPIIYEQDCPCILLDTQATCVLADVDKKTVDFIIDCPLRLLLIPELVEKSKKWISHSIGLQTGLRLFQNEEKNPFTRNKIAAIIPLGQDISHIKASDWAISQMFTSSKYLGNMNMWMAVIWFLCRDIPYLSEHFQSITSAVQYRFTTQYTYASLSSSATMVSTRLTVRNTLWWVLSCSHPDVLKELDVKYDPIRFHLPEINYILTLVETFVSKDMITDEMRHSINRTKWLSKLLALSKSDPSFIKNVQMCMYQACELDTSSNRIVSLVDGPQTNLNLVYSLIEKKCNYKELHSFTTEEVYSMLSLIDNNKSFGEIVYRLISIPEPITYWSYTTINKGNDYLIPICYHTFRPYSIYLDKERNTQTTWKESALYRFEIKSELELFPGTKYFLSFITEHFCRPTETEYIEWCNKRVSNSNRIKCNVLPCTIRSIYQCICKDYESVFERATNEGLTMKEIVQRILSSRSTVKRRQLEIE